MSLKCRCLAMLCSVAFTAIVWCGMALAFGSFEPPFSVARIIVFSASISLICTRPFPAAVLAFIIAIALTSDPFESFLYGGIAAVGTFSGVVKARNICKA